jgi:dTDP-4-amino-4,6-dideoxygalactose transaminase
MPSHASEPIPFVDLAAQQRLIATRINARMAAVLAHGQYVMGPEILELETALGAFAGARHVVSCSSGTDALALVLMAKGLKPGQAVICPSFTFCATAEVVAWLGATPVFVDVDADTFNMAPAELEAGIAIARQAGLEPVGVIPVDLFGLPADYGAILPMAERNGLWVLCDTAQAFGASYAGKRLGTLGLATATSFFPAKPLGCYGDGGAILTEDAALADIMRSLRVHGQGSNKYDNVRIGMAGRLDTLQAAVLLAKLEVFADELDARQRVAERYSAGLSGVCQIPRVPAGSVSAWAQYTLRVPRGRRDAIAAALKREGVPTAVYYPLGLHQQGAYRHYPRTGGKLEVTEQLTGEVLSLPFHPYLETATQDRVIDAVRRAVG